jgi:NADH-quinone oxidoreductase subunit L
VITAMHHEQDMRKMGGLARKIPFTALMMTIGNLALTGFPFTAGFYSKDAIIEAAYVVANPANVYAFTLLVLVAGMTSFYSWRLFFMTFWGETRADKHTYDHAKESPLSMTLPLGLLAIGAIFAGYPFVEYFIGHHADSFWRAALFFGPDNHVMHDLHDAAKIPAWVRWSPFVMMVLGFVVAWLFYVAKPYLPEELARSQPLAYRFLLNKWYIDELYDFVFVRGGKWLGTFLWKRGDGTVIDGIGPDGVSSRVLDVTGWTVRLQSGYVYHYAFAMLLGVAALFTYFMFGGFR